MNSLLPMSCVGLLICLLTISPVRAEEPEKYLATTGPTRIYLGKDKKSELLCEIPAGLSLVLVATEGDWHTVYGPNGEPRYVPVGLGEVANSIGETNDIEKKKAMYAEVTRCENYSGPEAEKKYPMAPGGKFDKAQMSLQIDYQRVIDDRCKLEAFARLGISPAQYSKILIEGVERNW